MSVDIILKDIEWDGVNKIRVPLEGGGTQDFSIGGGVTPTGNINITHSGQTDVTNYATATVPTADANAGSISSSYVTENNQRKWKFTYEGYAESPGWVDEGAFGSPLTYEYNAIPSNTTITPTTSAQTIGGQNYMMEGAVTVSAVPSMTLPATTSSSSTGTRRANLYPSTSQQYLNIPSGYNPTARYYQIIGMDLAPLNVTQNGTYNASDVDITGFNTVTVNVPTGGATLQTKSATYTPTTSQQTDTITPDSGYDGLDTVNITVNSVPMASFDEFDINGSSFYTENNQRKWHTKPHLVIDPAGWIHNDEYLGDYVSFNAIASNTTIYPSASSQTVGGANYMMEGAITVDAVTTNNLISSNIRRGVTVEVGDASDPDRILSVTGTYSGGASNLMTGTFTTGSSAGVGSVLVGYAGTGYPIACMVFVEGGSYVSGTDWYNSKQRYAVGFWSMSKSVQGTTPDYGTSGTQNQGVVTSVYKNSTSSATSYTRTSAMNNNVYTSNNASNSALNVIKLKANNILSYYTNTSSYGLHPNTTYRYYIIYSS